MQDVQPRDRFAVAIEPPLLRLGTLVAGLAAVVYLVAPRASPFLLLAMAAPALALAIPFRPSSKDIAHPAMAAGLAFCAYLAVNTLWSLNRIDAIGKVLLVLAMLLALRLAPIGLARLPRESLTMMVRTGLAAGAVGLGYLLFEELANHAIKQAIFNLLPFTRPSEKHVMLEGETVKSIYLYVSNRSVAALVLSLWPALLMLPSLERAGLPPVLRRWLLPAALLAIVAVVLTKSQHETSAIAMVLSLVAFLLAQLSRKAALGLLAAAWGVATLLPVPIVALAYKAGLHTNEALPDTARHRIIIWGYTAEQIARTPWLGVGLGSGKILDARNKTPEQPADHNYPRRTGTHSHNVYVQTWYELGAVGGLLLCAFGMAVLATISRLEGRLQPYAAATFAASATMAAFSWGMWQPWFMAAFGITALLFQLGAEASRRAAGDNGA